MNLQAKNIAFDALNKAMDNIQSGGDDTKTALLGFKSLTYAKIAENPQKYIVGNKVLEDMALGDLLVEIFDELKMKCKERNKK